MLVVTAGTEEYRDIIAKQAEVCARLGHDHVVYDLGRLGMGFPLDVPEADLKPSFNGDSLPPATFKARLVLNLLTGKDVVCWMDGDCLPLRDFLPPGEWDAAVTLRPLPEIGQCGISAMDYLNSGVIWIRDAAFARAWLAKSVDLNTDQGALNEIVAPNWMSEDWKLAHNRIIETPSGHKVLVLNAMEWNCWHLPPKPETRILHFKRGIRSAAGDYCR